MDQKDIDKLASELEKKLEPIAQEIGEAAAKKIEPFARIITLLSFIGASIFFIITLNRGDYGDSLIRLPFLSTENASITYIAAIIIFVITIWKLFSTIRFFVKRNK